MRGLDLVMAWRGCSKEAFVNIDVLAKDLGL